jgi:hypothetical protein
MADSEDQRRLRITISDEIEAILNQYDVGGVILLASRESASWRIILPSWSYLVDMGTGFALRIVVKKSEPETTVRTESTLHMVGSFRDLGQECVNVFGRMFRVAKMQIANHGSELEHKTFGGGKQRMDPQGGEGN